MGHDVFFTDKAANCDVLIFAKSDASYADVVKSKFKDFKGLVGAINIPADSGLKNIDFVIVGSIEEAASLAKYKNVFIYPLIELMYENITPKIHKKKDVLDMCYHGNSVHLYKLDSGFFRAINSFGKKVRLKIISSSIDKSFFREKKVNFIHEKWNIKTISSEILKSDIGVCPNITQISKKSNYKINQSRGLYSTDYFFRMKNKSNAGRAFVFHQLGIPVIGDITPSNYRVMGEPNCGLFAMNEDGWVNSIEYLLDHKNRNFVSKNAYNQFKLKYNPEEWAKNLIDNINNIKRKKHG